MFLNNYVFDTYFKNRESACPIHYLADFLAQNEVKLIKSEQSSLQKITEELSSGGSQIQRKPGR